MGGIAAPIMAISKAISASGAFFGVIDSESANLDGLKEPEVTSQSDIIFKDVTFAYPTRPDTTVLKGFSARFQRSKTTALVGPSGSGKSTIVGLIEGWYQLQTSSDDEKESIQGEILVDNHNLNDLDVKWWRSQVGLVQQEPFLFNDSIYQNVAFGLIGSKWEGEGEETKMKIVIAACKEAFADEFIERLPEVFPSSSFLTSTRTQKLTTSAGIFHCCWRRRNYPEWWPASKTSHREKHRQPAADLDPRRSD